MSNINLFEKNILFQDNHLIIINKKPGELTQGDKTNDKTLGEKVKYYLKEKYNKPGNVYLGITHRLDRPTSGIIIFTKTSKSLTRLNKMFKENSIKKTYWAIVNKISEKIRSGLINSSSFDYNAPSFRIWHQWDMGLNVGKGKKFGLTFFEMDRLKEKEIQKNDVQR